ncbi:hypothetical protein BG004_001598 [Podila humilis]|nr:hypothetical protein BG004_001598 [Podila humilis]
MALESFLHNVFHFLRGSSKSLVLSTLVSFHDREYLPNYGLLFENLAIDEPLKDNGVDKDSTERTLNGMQIMSIEWFQRRYEPYLWLSADCLAQNFVKDDGAAASLSECNYIMADGLDSLLNEYLLPSINWRLPRGTEQTDPTDSIQTAC